MDNLEIDYMGHRDRYIGSLFRVDGPVPMIRIPMIRIDTKVFIAPILVDGTP